MRRVAGFPNRHQRRGRPNPAPWTRAFSEEELLDLGAVGPADKGER